MQINYQYETNKKCIPNADNQKTNIWLTDFNNKTNNRFILFDYT